MSDMQHETGRSKAPARSKKDTAKLVAGAVLLVLLVLFVVANTEKTEISFLVTDVRLPLIVVLVATAVIGAAVAELLRHLHNRR